MRIRAARDLGHPSPMVCGPPPRDRGRTGTPTPSSYNHPGSSATPSAPLPLPLVLGPGGDLQDGEVAVIVGGAHDGLAWLARCPAHGLEQARLWPPLVAQLHAPAAVAPRRVTKTLMGARGHTTTFF